MSLSSYSPPPPPPSETFQDALRNAIAAPAGAMLTIEDFERSIDTAKFHLDIALGRATSDLQTAAVQQVAHEIFNFYITLVEKLIEGIRQGNSEKAIESIRADLNVGSLAKVFTLDYSVTILTIDVLANSVIGWIQKLFRDKAISQKTNVFYVQVAKSYRKILFSPIYSDKYKLISDIIDRSAKNIIQAMIALKEWDEAVVFIAILKARQSFVATAIEQDLLEGYRNSITGGLKKVGRFAVYASIGYSLALSLFFLLLIALLSDTNPLAILLAAAISIYIIRYFWRHEPEIRKLKARINKKVQEIIQKIKF